MQIKVNIWITETGSARKQLVHTAPAPASGEKRSGEFPSSLKDGALQRDRLRVVMAPCSHRFPPKHWGVLQASGILASVPAGKKSTSHHHHRATPMPTPIPSPPLPLTWAERTREQAHDPLTDFCRSPWGHPCQLPEIPMSTLQACGGRVPKPERETAFDSAC